MSPSAAWNSHQLTAGRPRPQMVPALLLLPLLLLELGAEAEAGAEGDEDTCRQLLDRFGRSSSSFTRCANQYAKPIFMCRKCVQDFVEVNSSFTALMESESEGIQCKDVLTSRDKVEIIKATFAYIAGPVGLWSRAACRSCFTSPLGNASHVTNITEKFFLLHGQVEECFAAHPNGSDLLNESEACTECQADYTDLSTFFRESVFSDRFPTLEGICFDILDTMNSTQRQWGSEHYHCGRPMHGSPPLITAIITVLLCPVAFYLLVWVSQRPPQVRTVLQPNITDWEEPGRLGAPEEDPVAAAGQLQGEACPGAVGPAQ